MRQIGLVILAACGAAQPHAQLAAGMFASPAPTRYAVTRGDRMPVTVTCKPVSNNGDKVRVECDSALPHVEGTWVTTAQGLYYAAPGAPEPDTDNFPFMLAPPAPREIDATDASGKVAERMITRRDGDAWCVDWEDDGGILTACFDAEGIVRGEQIQKDGDRQTTTYRYARVP